MNLETPTLARLLLLLLIFTSSVQAQPDTDISTWKKAVYNKFSFQYPGDWVIYKETVPGSLLLTVTPDSNTEKLPIKVIEFIQFTPQGHSFTDFKKDFIQGYAARIDNELKLVSRKDTTFKGMKAVYATVILYPGSDDEVPATMCAINGGSNFFLITRLSFKKRDEVADKLDMLTESIFRSLVIVK